MAAWALLERAFLLAVDAPDLPQLSSCASNRRYPPSPLPVSATGLTMNILCIQPQSFRLLTAASSNSLSTMQSTAIITK
ncbi:hypothetical protein BC831DRAFT_471211 [Entophlyctis helioformis]|nr:hypothetical protein BC831DRAFT_471211 [Entophlyctis helioformis]